LVEILQGGFEVLKKLVTATVGLSLICLLVPAAPVFAENVGKTWHVEGYVGAYIPKPDIFDNQVTLGGRVGYDFTKNMGLEGSLGWFGSSKDFDVSPGVTAEIDADFIMTDFSFVYTLFPEKKFNPKLYGGIGGAFVSADVLVDAPGGGIFFSGIDDDAFTVHFGGGSKISINEVMYFRFAGRMRYYENRDDDEIDSEFTGALGYTFGQQ
jgi:hypothetical protein